MFTPSTFQAAIFDWIEGGRGDGIVNAVAGAGKTTTLVQAARRLRSDSSLFVAFNKHVADELAHKLAGTGMVAKTIHSVGNGVLYKHLGKTRIEERKYRQLAQAFIDRHAVQLAPDERSDAAATLHKLANLARLTLTNPHDPRALAEMGSHFQVEPSHPLVFQGLPVVLEEGQRLAEVGKTIDFTDMIWLPVIWQLPPAPVAWVFVDECQDLNACQLELVLRLRAPGGRMLLVGDPRQSIMGFAGADSASFHKIQARTAATSLPLSICYRCPTTHLDLARAIVPHIEARPNAPAGEVLHAGTGDLSKLVREGDLVLCRVTAPLVTECIRLIRQRVPARVRGRDIGKDLCAILRRLEKMPGFDYAHLTRLLQEYLASQIAYLIQKDADQSQIESLHDRVECLQVCVANFEEARTVAALCSEIDALFSDDRPSVWLSTVHRAKGLENDRVFVLHPEKLPLRWKNQQPWQLEQEENLRYVALTRARQTLIFLDGQTNQAEAHPAAPVVAAPPEPEPLPITPESEPDLAPTATTVNLHDLTVWLHHTQETINSSQTTLAEMRAAINSFADLWQQFQQQNG